MGWESFWNGVADKCFAAADKAERKRQSRIDNATLGVRLGIPRCLFCKSKARDFTNVTPFTYSVDRLSRGRVKAILRCNTCDMQAVIMRSGNGSRWYWNGAN